MKRVLIAYDGSPQAETALDELSRTGLSPELEVLVMSVADVWLPQNQGNNPEAFPETASVPVRRARDEAKQAVASAQALAERAAAQLAHLHPKWCVSGYACGDSPAWALITKAAEWRANLVVLGSHGRGVLERFFLGSVSAKVAAEAICSVRIARPRPELRSGRFRLVIAVDGSADSQTAVREVASRLWPPYCEFHVVAVIDQRMESSLAWAAATRSDWGRQSNEGAREALARIVEKDARALYDTGLMVETHLLTGDPKHELLNHAEIWEADSIFIGARGLHHGGRLSLGTLASAVATRAHCSVEIVRPV